MSKKLTFKEFFDIVDRNVVPGFKPIATSTPVKNPPKKRRSASEVAESAAILKALLKPERLGTPICEDPREKDVEESQSRRMGVSGCQGSSTSRRLPATYMPGVPANCREATAPASQLHKSKPFSAKVQLKQERHPATSRPKVPANSDNATGPAPQKLASNVSRSQAKRVQIIDIE